MLYSTGHVARTNSTEGQALWQPQGAEEDSFFHAVDRHLHLVQEVKKLSYSTVKKKHKKTNKKILDWVNAEAYWYFYNS